MARKPRAADASVGGRPSADIDVKAVERAAAIGCTVDEISAVVGVSRSTFYDHMKVSPALQEAVSRGRETGRATLRRLQWQRANSGSDTMLIWLGKQMLEQKDRSAHEVRHNLPIATAADAALLAIAISGGGVAVAAETDQDRPDGVVH